MIYIQFNYSSSVIYVLYNQKIVKGLLTQDVRITFWNYWFETYTVIIIYKLHTLLKEPENIVNI